MSITLPGLRLLAGMVMVTVLLAGLVGGATVVSVPVALYPPPATTIEPVGAVRLPGPVTVAVMASEVSAEIAPVGLSVTPRVELAVPASETHLFTTLYTFSDPRPVASRSRCWSCKQRRPPSGWKWW